MPMRRCETPCNWAISARIAATWSPRCFVDQKRPDPAKQLLQDALDEKNQGIFVNRQEAQALLETLK